jgi:hypothetical protein
VKGAVQLVTHALFASGQRILARKSLGGARNYEGMLVTLEMLAQWSGDVLLAQLTLCATTSVVEDVGARRFVKLMPVIQWSQWMKTTTLLLMMPRLDLLGWVVRSAPRVNEVLSAVLLADDTAKRLTERLSDPTAKVSDLTAERVPLERLAENFLGVL